VSRIFWDTNLFIYLFEKNVQFYSPTAALRKRMIERKDELMTSAMTLGEIQVGPRRTKDVSRAEKYRDAIRHVSAVIPFDERAADIYAQLRENVAIKPPDAIQLSCAAAVGVELFITNDVSLQKLKVPGIHFITSLDRVPI
jgi:predicted nucleic acid-binding protein